MQGQCSGTSVLFGDWVCSWPTIAAQAISGIWQKYLTYEAKHYLSSLNKVCVLRQDS